MWMAVFHLLFFFFYSYFSSPLILQVARVESWVRKYAEALSTPNMLQKIRNTVRSNAMKTLAGRSLLARNPLPEQEGLLGGVGSTGELSPTQGVIDDDSIGQKRKRSMQLFVCFNFFFIVDFFIMFIIFPLDNSYACRDSCSINSKTKQRNRTT